MHRGDSPVDDHEEAAGAPGLLVFLPSDVQLIDAGAFLDDELGDSDVVFGLGFVDEARGTAIVAPVVAVADGEKELLLFAVGDTRCNQIRNGVDDALSLLFGSLRTFLRAALAQIGIGHFFTGFTHDAFGARFHGSLGVTEDAVHVEGEKCFQFGNFLTIVETLALRVPDSTNCSAVVQKIERARLEDDKFGGKVVRRKARKRTSTTYELLNQINNRVLNQLEIVARQALEAEPQKPAPSATSG